MQEIVCCEALLQICHTNCPDGGESRAELGRDGGDTRQVLDVSVDLSGDGGDTGQVMRYDYIKSHITINYPNLLLEKSRENDIDLVTIVIVG